MLLVVQFVAHRVVEQQKSNSLYRECWNAISQCAELLGLAFQRQT